jgi:hypothetical protein
MPFLIFTAFVPSTTSGRKAQARDIIGRLRQLAGHLISFGYIFVNIHSFTE